MRLIFVTTLLVVVLGSVAQCQQSKTKEQPRSFPVEVFQILGLPLNVHEAVMVEGASGYVLRCRTSNEASSEILGLRYSMTVIDALGRVRLAGDWTHSVRLEAYGMKSLSFMTPIRIKPKQGDRLVFMMEQVLTAETIWEVIKAKDALDAYVKGDYSVQPNVMRVANQVDALPQIRVIY